MLGLHLEQDGRDLRLWDPQTPAWLPTPAERLHQAELARQQAEQRAEHAEHAEQESQAREHAEQRAEELAAEIERLRQ